MLMRKNSPTKMSPSAMAILKSPRFVYIMMAVVMTLVLYAMAPPTIETAPTSARARPSAKR